MARNILLLYGFISAFTLFILLGVSAVGLKMLGLNSETILQIRNLSIDKQLNLLITIFIITCCPLLHWATLMYLLYLMWNDKELLSRAQIVIDNLFNKE